jgi:hypothetical protein
MEKYIKANKLNTHVNIWLSTEKHIISKDEKVYTFENWEEYENWLPDDCIVENFSKEAKKSHQKHFNS